MESQAIYFAIKLQNTEISQCRTLKKIVSKSLKALSFSKYSMTCGVVLDQLWKLYQSCDLQEVDVYSKVFSPIKYELLILLHSVIVVTLQC